MEADASAAADAAAEAVQRLGIHRHPLAKSLVARKLLRRLIEDGTALAHSDAKGEQTPYKLRDALLSAELGAAATGAAGRREVVAALVQALSDARDADNATIDAMMPALLGFKGDEGVAEPVLRARALAQRAGSEPYLSLELLGQLMMSSRGEAELCLLFPPLTPTAAAELLSRASELLLVMSRSLYVMTGSC